MSKIKTLNDIIKYEKELTIMFDSDIRVAMAILEEIRKLNQNKEIQLCTPDICRHGY